MAANNLAEMNGHPAFLMPLYDGVTPFDGRNPEFSYGVGGKPMLRFVERYQRFMAFEATKDYKIAYARCIDISDYYRRHYKVTPRTVFVSKTDHILYDSWWIGHMGVERLPAARERIPWITATSTIMQLRRTRPYWKDSLSSEFILVEDQKRSIRFERESANPIWWFDYTNQERGVGTQGIGGSAITHVETPYVEVIRSGWRRQGDVLTMNLNMRTDTSVVRRWSPKMTFEGEFQDFAIALWGLPTKSNLDASMVETNAKEFVLAKNVDGEQHLVLFFDLRPNVEIQVALRDA